MNSLVAQMTGQRVREDVPVPVAAKAQPRFPRRRGHNVQRRTAAAIMGMAEAQDAIIPDEAEEIDNYGGPAGTKIDRDQVDRDKEPDQPLTPDSAGDEPEDGQLISPQAALVAPDVTPQTLEPIDPSQVPQAPAQAAPPVAPTAAPSHNVNPLDVIMGRNLGRNQRPEEPLPPENPVTAESAQASINATLGVSTPADLLGQGREMPPPQPGDSKKIMEAFYRFRH